MLPSSIWESDLCEVEVKLKTDPVRSALMQSVRRSRTAPEDVVAAALRALGYSYRRNVVSLPGSPDLANISRGWAIFVNGCFWHRHKACKRSSVPKRNANYWEQKFQVNRNRDARNIRALRGLGFSVIIVWECDLKHYEKFVQRIGSQLSNLGPHGNHY